jgi:hypothetical protein
VYKGQDKNDGTAFPGKAFLFFCNPQLFPQAFPIILCTHGFEKAQIFKN